MNNLDALDIVAAFLAYMSLHSFEANQEQNKKLDAIIYDIEQKLEYQDKKLNEILRKVEQLNGK